MPLRWKVCGVTRRRDAAAAVQAGADAIGLVFYPPSPRHLEIERAAKIAAAIPETIWRIGVFVDRTAQEMEDVVDAVGLDFLQLSGDEAPSVTSGLSRHAFKALRLDPTAGPAEAFAAGDRYPECTLLVDAAVPGEYGGTGLAANRVAAAALATRHRLMLAGGLRADNVADAVNAVRPWAVDVSSGVESAPGRKDPDKLRAFARALEPFR